MSRMERILDVLAPRSDHSLYPDELEGRMPIFEWGHEETPTLAELRELAERILAAIDTAAPGA